MSSKENIWHQLWNDSKPLAAKRQPTLFDYQSEAEKVCLLPTAININMPVVLCSYK